jgi:hypothetical protein
MGGVHLELRSLLGLFFYLLVRVFPCSFVSFRPLNLVHVVSSNTLRVIYCESHPVSRPRASSSSLPFSWARLDDGNGNRLLESTAKNTTKAYDSLSSYHRRPNDSGRRAVAPNAFTFSVRPNDSHTSACMPVTVILSMTTFLGHQELQGLYWPAR